MNECPHGLFDVCCTNPNYCSIDEPKKEWVGLTDEEIEQIVDQYWEDLLMFAEAIEAKLKEKNG